MLFKKKHLNNILIKIYYYNILENNIPTQKHFKLKTSPIS